jgi:hypothetical protein
LAVLLNPIITSFTAISAIVESILTQTNRIIRLTKGTEPLTLAQIFGLIAIVAAEHCKLLAW